MTKEIREYMSPALVTTNSALIEKLNLILPLLLTEESFVPEDWSSQATTYDLPRHYSEPEFISRFVAVIDQLIDQHIMSPSKIKSLLESCGHPYDYARLGQPLSTVYELYVQELTGVEAVISFASTTKPFLAVLEARKKPFEAVKLYCEHALPISETKKQQLLEQQVEVYENWSEPIPDSSILTLYIMTQECTTSLEHINADAVTFPVEEGGVLLLKHAHKFDLKALQIIRKRTVSALLAANSERELKKLLNIELDEPVDIQASDCSQLMHAIYSGVSPSNIAYFCTGLAAEAAVFSAAAEELYQGVPVKLYYAANGYGGTGQLIGEVLPEDGFIQPCPLNVLGVDDEGQTITLIEHFIEDIQQNQASQAILFLETPTNPELQMHDFEKLIRALKHYQHQNDIIIPVIVDTTMAPLYQLFEQEYAKDWPFLIVKSGSKYYTKGKATLGVAFCGHQTLAKSILERSRAFATYSDTFAKGSQLLALKEGLKDLVPRMATIAENTKQIADHLRAEMASRGFSFTCYSMTPEQVEAGLASGIISFYLPSAPTPEGIDLVDEFVDYCLKQAPDLVRNRVSYGQSSGQSRDFIYIINPQESTQGSLSAEVKEAQKKDNVQICRISVPQFAAVEELNTVMSRFFDYKYSS